MAAGHCLGSAHISKRGAARGLQFDKSHKQQAQIDLLQLVNKERAAAGVSTLLLDDLACLVADQHALDMATGGFLSHWGRDGRKPYHRYSSAGAVDAIAENVSATSNLESLDRKYIDLTVAQAHMRMHAEIPPNDGHRRTILAPQNTHVGFGLALLGRELRLVELYVARYVQIELYQMRAKRKATVQIKGRLLNHKYALYYAEIFYEPLPRPPEMGWLNAPRAYGMPDDFTILRPKLSAGTLYADEIEGTIKVNPDGRFDIPVKLNRREAGIYTVVIWVSKRSSGERFPVTNACIQVE
jgi:uncharacterized protein YkwD